MTDADKTILDHIEREALAMLERATFSIRDDDHALAVHTNAQAASRIIRRPGKALHGSGVSRSKATSTG